MITDFSQNGKNDRFFIKLTKSVDKPEKICDYYYV